MSRFAGIWSQIFTSFVMLLVETSITAAAEPQLATHLRRPVALITQGHRVLTGNRRSGTISVIDATSGHIRAEHTVADRIADMANIPGTPHILVLDDGDGQLRKISLHERGVSITSIAEVPPGTAKLSVATDRPQVFVTAKWSHRVLALTFDAEFEQLRQSKSISLPFAPQELLLVNEDQTLLVADAFGGQIAALDANDGKLHGVRKLIGHNIRGLAISSDGQQLHVAHQQMSQFARADYEDLHWGQMLTNAVQVFDVVDLLTGESGHLTGGWVDTQGGIGGGTGDPGGVVTGPDGSRVVALSGVGEISVRRGGTVKRISVQARPEAMAVDEDRLYVANRLDDSVSIVDLRLGKVVKTVALGPTPELTPVDRGERLFFDARLSHDGWISCHSCHTDGHSTGLLVDTLGDGDYGAPKRIPSLLGTRDTKPWGWNGSMVSLHEQVRKSVTTTMHGKALSEEQASDLVAYLESLSPPQPVHHATPEQIRDGRVIFAAQGCVDCHTSPTFTSNDTFDVGLRDEHSRSFFNPPSLRGVDQRDRFFHDGRAHSLEDVLLQERHQLAEPLSPEASAALLSYLRSL